MQQKNSGVWFFDDAIRIEEELFASGMDSTILKPAVMLEGNKKGVEVCGLCVRERKKQYREKTS